MQSSLFNYWFFFFPLVNNSHDELKPLMCAGEEKLLLCSTAVLLHLPEVSNLLSQHFQLFLIGVCCVLQNEWTISFIIRLKYAYIVEQNHISQFIYNIFIVKSSVMACLNGSVHSIVSL